MFMKKTAFILAGLILALSVTSCSGTESTDSGNAVGNGVQAETQESDALEETAAPEEAEPTRESISDDLPERNYDGYDFCIVTRGRDDFIKDIGADLELTGDVVNDAYYNRNIAVMDRFNINITGEYVDQNNVAVHTAVEATVMAGDDAYGMAVNQCTNMAAVGPSGLYLDWYTQLPYVNLKKPWYIGNAADVLSVHGHAYAMAGEWNMDIMRFTSAFFYNRNIAADYDLENIYNVVNEGRWTLDYLMTLADTVYEDLNADGKKDFSDRLAVAGDPYDHAIFYQYAFDIPIARQDTDGFPTIVLDQEKAHDSVVKLNTMYWDSIGGKTQDWGSGAETWFAGNLLCLTGTISDAAAFGNVEFDYAIIPYPKYNEEQEAYYSSSAGAHGLETIPISVADREKVSIIVEALNAETYKKVVPAYFETTLKTRYSRDEESSRILEMLVDARVFDFGFMNRAGLHKVFWDLISTNQDNTASKYASLIPATEKLYSEIIDGYLKLEETLN